MQHQPDSDPRRAKITDENRAESNRLLSIWNTMKPTLVARGYGSQDAFGAMFGIGSQAAVGHFLNGRSAISPKAAAGFAQGLECKVSDFSPRLAALLNESTAPSAPKHPGPQAAAPTLELCLEHVARALMASPERVREQMGRELALLASVPDSHTLVQRIATALSPFTSAQVSRSPDTAPGFATLLARRLEGVSDPRERERLFALVDEVIERESSHPDTAKGIPPSRDLPPR